VCGDVAEGFFPRITGSATEFVGEAVDDFEGPQRNVDLL
jgi:hypothetical protein